MFGDEDFDDYFDYDDGDDLYEFDPDEVDRFDEAVENMNEVYNDWDDN